MHMRGEIDAARAALNRSFVIAEERGDALEQVRLLGPLHMFHLRGGDFKATLDYARRCSTIAETVGDSVATALAHSILGISLHLTGDLSRARHELEAALEHWPGFQQASTIYLGFAITAIGPGSLSQGPCGCRAIRLRLWSARQAISDAARMDHPISLTIVLHWAASVFLWTGDLQGAEEHIDWFISRAETHSLGPSLAIGLGFKGELAIRLGDATRGIGIVQNCIDKLRAARYELLTTPFNISLVQGFGATGRFAESIALVDETIRSAGANGDACYAPELLRVKGGLLLSMPEPSGNEAETCFTQSFELSRRQGARAWELRTAIDLAPLWGDQGRTESARTLLRPVFEMFEEGSNTADLKAAERLLATLG
jgi:hypothetical protein